MNQPQFIKRGVVPEFSGESSSHRLWRGPHPSIDKRVGGLTWGEHEVLATAHVDGGCKIGLPPPSYLYRAP